MLVNLCRDTHSRFEFRSVPDGERPPVWIRVFHTHSEQTRLAQCSFSFSRALALSGSVRRAWFPFAQMQPWLQIFKGDLSK